MPPPSSAASPGADRLGTKIGSKYELTEVLGEGGMGVVYGGRHAWTGRAVAVKLLHASIDRGEQAKKRFLREARVVAALEHPNVIEILDMGEEEDGSLYMVLEKLRGRPLDERLKGGPISLGELAEILLPVMDALATAHEAGIVHRDLKPANLFLAETPRGLRPTVLDFGIAKITEPADGPRDLEDIKDSLTTRTGVLVGTPWYMSPEQVKSSKELGPPTDVWALGVILYQCLTGTFPFEADSLIAILGAIVTQEPLSLRAGS